MQLEGLEQTALEGLAADLATRLEPGDVVVLAGEVGAGKTTFVRAAARSLGVQGRVTSPTYQIARGYEGDSVKINHLDLYRLEGLEDRDALEIDDYLDPGSITFVEWAEPALGLMQNPTVVRISHETPATRRVNISGPAAERISRC